MDRALDVIIEAKYERCVARVVHRLRRISPAEWQADDAPERTVWDHWKREMQEEHSVIHELLENMVESVVWQVVESLPNEDGALMMLATNALDDLEDEPAELIFAPEAVAEELLVRVNNRADDEPHRAEVQRLLDDEARDRFERDTEPYRRQ